ncbi:M20 family peptidase [Bacillus sp. HNG]|uniref:Sapep family Mn(2+)-dependent dipeptidase n=1 Tax=Bacillus sp. HNG TaxID=2293325 RepID=UPI000E2FE0F1|nr:Sapep family Mn(2+)-dependent dipeptidase [Bacillus sp. HNG]RFB18014.1 M20 family peptidase [Bacillus sp. HNG]
MNMEVMSANSIVYSYYEKLQQYEEELFKDLADLVAIRSVLDEKTASTNSPFGKGIRDVFDKMQEIARRDSFRVSDFDGYAMHIEQGSGEEIVGVLAHLDVVPEGNREDWIFDPFILTEFNGELYGRGVNDDKAPALAAYYAMKILRDLGISFNRKIRLILGGAEETSWECMNHYFKHNPQPTMAFSPDGDFPIVNGEKGVVQGSFFLDSDKSSTETGTHELVFIDSEKQWGFICERIRVVFRSSNPEKLASSLTGASKIEINDKNVTAYYIGEKQLSRNPYKGENVFFAFAEDLLSLGNEITNSSDFQRFIEYKLLDDVYGKKLGLFYETEEMGHSTFGITFITFDGNEYELGFDYRYPKLNSKIDLSEQFKEIGSIHGLSVIIHKKIAPLYVDPNSTLIRNLSEAYRNVTGKKAEVMTKGGISYSRALTNCVAFGPTFEGDNPNTHKPNEKIKIETLYKAIIIYCEAIRLLATS